MKPGYGWQRDLTGILISLLFLSFFALTSAANLPAGTPQKEYTGNELAALNAKLAKGWNTWNTRSVLSHVLLPEGLAVNLQLKVQKGDILEEALIGKDDYGTKERVIPGPHAYNGSYTELEVKWRNIHLRVQSASVKDDLFLLITPIKAETGDSLIIQPKMLWGRKGEIAMDQNLIRAETPGRSTKMVVTGNRLKTTSTNLKASLDQVIAISSGKAISLKETEKTIAKAKADFEAGRAKFSKTPELYNAMQTVLAWDLIYEPTHDRVIAPVSRTWNVGWEGWILFDWDTYFAAYMFSLDNRELAYANAIAITKEITKSGFIPNFGSARCTSEDRSQPPVGSFVVREIYRKYQEKWFLHEVFNELLSWNRWWAKNRDIDGYLCYGSDPYAHGKLPDWLEKGIGTKKGAKWESGLDNSPMWDEAAFDSVSHRMLLADVGLMSFYVKDCQCLSEIANLLGKPEIAKELTARGEKYAKKLETLWDDQFGLYLNKNLATGKFSKRLSPTLFYPLLAKIPGQDKAERMMKEHFYNPDEFWGEFIMPSISRKDTAFHDNDYWRGRIWAPMNFLVYLGIRNYELPDARKDLVEKSRNLLLKSWLGERHIYENYNSVTGQGSDGRSDAFYHWGALLGFIGIMEEGYYPSPQSPLKTEK